MSHQFENPQYSEDPKDLSSFSNVFNAVSGVEQGQHEGDVEGENTEEINDVEERNYEEDLKHCSVRKSR